MSNNETSPFITELVDVMHFVYDSVNDKDDWYIDSHERGFLCSILLHVNRGYIMYSPLTYHKDSHSHWTGYETDDQIVPGFMVDIYDGLRHVQAFAFNKGEAEFICLKYYEEYKRKHQ